MPINKPIQRGTKINRPIDAPYYEPHEQLAARIIASLIYHDYPSGPDLDTDAGQCGYYRAAIDACRDHYEDATIRMQMTGQLYDCPGGAAMVWEGYRMMTGSATPYAKIDPLIRAYGGAADITALETAMRGPARTNGTKPADAKAEYTEITTPHPISGLFAERPEPVVYYAGGFLREGLGLYVGEPGVGKTPAVMQLGMSIATGTPWLGTVPCKQAKVLYWGIEYSRKELYPLIKASQFGHDLSDDWFRYMTLDDSLPESPEQALNQLEFYIRTLGFRVIILDVFTGFLPPEIRKQSIYRGDYKEMQPYHKLALQYEASILGTWHSTKRESDPRWMHNASTGIWAVPSSRITMYFDTELRVRIHSKPRLGDKIDWALTQERSTRGHRWIVADANPEPVCSPTELTIYRFLKNNSGKEQQLGPSTTAEMVNIPIGTAKTLLLRMYERNLIHRGQSGYYIERSDVADVANVSSVAGVAGVADQTATNVAACSQFCSHDSGHQDAPNPERLQRLHDSLDTTIQSTDLFADDTPAGLTPAQWEQARYTHATGRHIEFADVARTSGMDYHHLLRLVDDYGKDNHHAT